jgi:hypothetical protein
MANIERLRDECDEAHEWWLAVRNGVRNAERDKVERECEEAANAYVDAMLSVYHSLAVDNKGRPIKYRFDAVQAELETTLCRMEALGLVEGYGDPSGTAREQADAIAARELAIARADAADLIWNWKPSPRKPKFNKRCDKKRRDALARARALNALRSRK